MKRVLFVLVVLILVLLLAFWWRDREEPPSDAERLDLMRTALAETENLHSAAADSLWSQVIEQTPDDPAALRNRSVARVSLVQELSQQLHNMALPAAERQAIAERLPEAIQRSREAVEQLSEVAEDDPAVPWFRAHVDRAAAALLPDPQRRPAMLESIERLLQQIDQRPGALILVGPAVEMAAELDDPIEGLPPDLVGSLATTLSAAADANPRNLMAALVALEYQIRDRRPAAAARARQTAALAESIDGLIRRDAEPTGMTPQELAESIAQAVEEEDWNRADSLRFFWFNILNGTEILRTDRKRATPNVLDLVEVRPINRLANQLAAENPIPPERASPRFERRPPQADLGPVRFVTSVDFDLADPPEIAVLADDQVHVLQRDGEADWSMIASAPVADDAVGIVVADLFMVDDSSPDRIKRFPGDADDEDLARLARQHDTFPSLLIYGPAGIDLLRIDGRPDVEGDRLLPPVRPTGLEEIRDVTAVAVGDVDADGDLDLIVATEAEGVTLWINRGNMTFFSVEEHSQMPPPDDPIISMAIVDLDRDLALDVVTLSRGGQIGWLENLLHLQYRWQPLTVLPPVAAARSIAVAEWDGNVSWDLLFSGARSLELALSETPAAGVIRFDETVTAEGAGGTLRVADLDNDSWPDALHWGEDGLWVTPGNGVGFDQERRTRLFDGPVDSATVFDSRGDGLLDIVLISEGQLHWLVNATPSDAHYLAVRFKGKDDNNPASGRINHYAIGSVLELRFGHHYRAQVITERTSHFGLDGIDTADTLRVIFPNGITQNTIEPPVDTVLDEEQTLKGSCPYLYSWDGERFVFVTDCLWAAPLGLQVARGQVAPDRPWEYLKVPGELVAPRDGHYELRITEELWELAYIDHVELIAVDRPEGVEIWTNEKVGPPSVAEPTIFAFNQTRPVRSAVDTEGNDVTALLAEADEQYVQGFDYRLRQGLTPPHWIDLDLGPLAEDDRVLLVLTGWILPTDTSLNIQIDQNPDLPAVEYPSVWVPSSPEPREAQKEEPNEEQGEEPTEEAWEQVIPFMGFPGGKTKTIVVDLTGVVRAEDPRVRIRTSAQIYWDAAAVAVNPPEVPLRTQTLALADAQLGFHGFSRQLPRTDRQPHRYDYDDAVETPRWPPLRGNLTRYGDVRELLERWDDSMVVMAGGDELRLRFRVPDRDPPEGWKRDFVLHCVGWDKDADLNTLEGQSADPLPFRSMTAYPPPADQRSEQDRVERLNAPHRTRQQSFRAFWSRGGGEPPVPFLDVAPAGR